MSDEELNGIIRALELCTGNETTCKDCPYRAAVSPSFSVRCEDTLREASLEAIEALKDENAALRERLEKAEAKKSKLNPYIEQDNDGDYLVYRAEYILQYIIDSICRTHEAALARLAELKGGKE